MTNKFQLFLNLATIVLSAILGTLIVIPLLSSGLHPVCTLLGGFLGGLIGYRRKDSRFFFYFVLVSILVLSSVLSFKVFEPMQ